MNVVSATLSPALGFPDAMASYAVSERRLSRAIRDLHDYLWAGKRADEGKLLPRLLRGARDLDGHLGTRGKVERAVHAISREFRRGAPGADLFTFLQAVAGLSYAADRVRRQPREAAKAASELGVSLSVHLATAAGAENLVDQFESGRRDFGEFVAALRDALEAAGVLRAAEFGRAVNLAFDIHALWDDRLSREAKRVMATTSLSAAAFASVVFVEALRSLGRYREKPYAALVPVAATILSRQGGHP